MAEDLSVDIQERGFIDLIKENILQDNKRGTENTTILKDYILLLKQEILHQNTVHVETGSPPQNKLSNPNDSKIFNMNF